MEFYELNRLYDENLACLSISKIVDRYLYILMPMFISFGCGISLLNIIALSNRQIDLTSKNYLFSQSIFNFLFQIITSIILLTNYYEKVLINNYFANRKQLFLNLKLVINLFYNVNLYCIIWLFTIGALDYCFISIIKFHVNSNYNKDYASQFIQQQAHFSFIKEKYEPRIRNFQNSLRSNAMTPHKSTITTYQPNQTHVINQPYADEYGMYEIDNQNTNAFDNQSIESDPDESAVFCKPKTILYTIFSIILISLFLGFPQFFAYEVKRNTVSVSASSMPPNLNSDNFKLFENIYFIQEEVEEDQFFPELVLKTTTIANPNPSAPQTNAFNLNLNKQARFAYSNNVAKAYAITIDMNQRQYAQLAKLKKTHSSFFTLSGLFNFASKRFELCNTLQNSKTFEKQRKIITDPLINFTQPTLNDIQIVNVTLICIKKSDLNSYLTYNTLYFWLEHTMVVSVPIFIILVVLISLIYVYIKVFKFMTQQTNIRQKRRKIYKILTQIINLNNQEKLSKRFIPKTAHGNVKNESLNEETIKTPSTPLTPKTIIKQQKSVQIQDTDVENELESELFYLGLMPPPATSHILNDANDSSKYEKEIRARQEEYQNLNKMFIIDLTLFVLISLPYTIMRLVLDLFVKDRIKISLDFFILYKFSLLVFHLHLILKFLLWIVFNVKFRICLARVFAFRPSYCCVNEYDVNAVNRKNSKKQMSKSMSNKNCTNDFTFNTNLENNSNSIKLKRFLFCCFNGKHGSESLSNRFDNGESGGGGGGGGGADGACDEDDELNAYHSTEFNSNLHQYSCPADPDEDYLDDYNAIKFKNQKFNFLDQNNLNDSIIGRQYTNLI